MLLQHVTAASHYSFPACPKHSAFGTGAVEAGVEVGDGSRSVHHTIWQRKTELLGLVTYAATLYPG